MQQTTRLHCTTCSVTLEHPATDIDRQVFTIMHTRIHTKNTCDYCAGYGAFHIEGVRQTCPICQGSGIHQNES